MAYTQQEINNMLRGRTADQQKTIRYFTGTGGCLASSWTDQTYDAAVLERIRGINFKQRALSKLGIDESQVSEIEPVMFSDYYFNIPKTFVGLGKDLKWRSSAYQITWLFFSDTQVYVYQYTFHMDENTVKERAEEFFYKDITNFTSSTDTEEVEAPQKNCTGGLTWVRKSANYTRFSIVVPGDRLNCSAKENEYLETSIRGMKAKLREKKGL